MICNFGQIFRVPEVILVTCNMGAHDLSDMYARPQPFGPVALRLWACISGKSHVATITCDLQLASNITCSWVTAYTYMQLL